MDIAWRTLLYLHSTMYDFCTDTPIYQQVYIRKFTKYTYKRTKKIVHIDAQVSLAEASVDLASYVIFYFEEFYFRRSDVL